MSSLTLPTFIDDATVEIKNLYFFAGEIRQNQWNRLLDIIGDNPSILWCFGSWFVFVITYWLVGGVYTFFDITNKTPTLRQYKVQPGTNEPITKKNLIKIISVVLFNQIVVSLPLAWFMGQIMIKNGGPPVRELPPFYKTIVEIMIMTLIEEVGFYYSHRLLHHRLIYKHIHKKHHEWTAPISIVALYANPIEHIFSNIMPPFLGIFILNCHISTAWLWFSLSIAYTLSEHSGYHLPFFPSSEAHDFHHFKFTNCYGVLGLLDWLHGTDLEFKKTMSYPRHRILKSLTPARVLYPDSNEQKNFKKQKEMKKFL